MTQVETPFPIDNIDSARLLSRALARGGDFAELFFEHSLAISLHFEQQKVRSFSRHVDAGCGVRVVTGEASGYAYTEDLDVDAIGTACDTAAHIASGQPGAPPHEIKMRSLPNRYQPERCLIDLPFLDRVALLRRADEAARAADPRVEAVEVSLVESRRQIRVVRSDGERVDDDQPMLRMNIMVVVSDGDKRQKAMEGGGGRLGLEYFERHRPEDLARHAVKTALKMLDAKPAPAGEFPVVLAAGDSGVLFHEAVGHGLEADFNRKGTSNYSGRVGELVASSLCTVVDDPGLDADRGCINVDDEGCEPQRRVLIRDGVLEGYMHDRISAKAMGAAPGSGRRESFRCLPMPRMSSTYLEAGEEDPEEILKSVSYGIYAKQFSGGQVNISNGDFVFSTTEAYLIEDGRITAPLQGVNLIGNGPDCLSKVDAVGHDFVLSDGRWTCGKNGQGVPVGIGMPTLRISAMTVGGSEL